MFLPTGKKKEKREEKKRKDKERDWIEMEWNGLVFFDSNEAPTEQIGSIGQSMRMKLEVNFAKSLHEKNRRKS